MARTKFNTIRIEYAGADLVSGGMLADVSGALNGSTRYTTQAVPHLGADAVELDESGNLERECSVSVAVDYGSEGGMLADVMARQGFADEHQRGVLRYVVGVPANARAVVTPLAGFPAPYYALCVMEVGHEVKGMFTYGGGGDAAALVDALNDLANWGAGPGQPMVAPLIHAELDGDGKIELEVVDAAWAGGAGNALRIVAGAPGTELPFSDETPVAFSDGADATVYAFSAGLTGFEYSSTLGGGGLRVVFTYTFTAGADAGA